jgi:hypothetical protein
LGCFHGQPRLEDGQASTADGADGCAEVIDSNFKQFQANYTTEHSILRRAFLQKEFAVRVQLR